MRYCASVNGIASAGLRPMDIACNFGNCYNSTGMYQAFKNTWGGDSRWSFYDYLNLAILQNFDNEVMNMKKMCFLFIVLILFLYIVFAWRWKYECFQEK